MHDDICCEELAVMTKDFTGNYFILFKFMFKSTCTRKICSKNYLPGYNMGSNSEEQLIFAHQCGKCTYGTEESKLYQCEKKNNLGGEIISSVEI